MLKLDSIAMAPDADEKGVRVESVFFPGVYYTVRPIDYAPYQSESAKEILAIRKGGEASSSEQAKLRARLVGKHILLGWEGFDVPYSPEKAGEYLNNPAFRKLVDDVEFCASKAAQVEFEFVEELAKN